MNKILIGVPTRDISGFLNFYDHFNMIEKPAGTLVHFVRGQSPARNRNVIIKTALDNDCTHILFLDDDTVPPPNVLTKLLSHDLDMVTGLYLMRHYPFKPILFDECKPGRFYHYHFLEDGKNDLVEVVNAGLGCALIKTDVFRRMLEHGLAPEGSSGFPTWITLGEAEKDHWSDDTVFFEKAQLLGYKLYADLSVCSGHATTAIVRPAYRDGKWYTTLDTNGEAVLTMPAVQPAPELV